MSTTQGNQGRPVKACRDRCEVCNTVIEHRPVANRRRCADHLDQLALVPVALVRKAKNSRSGSGEGTR
jgi:hypothetical protein